MAALSLRSESGSESGLKIFYSEALSHQIYAAADIVLVPSMFEPCGLTQMIGMRYGAVPVVRRTGGLADTVRDVEGAPEGEGSGYVFDGTDEASLYGALDRALKDFKADPAAWGRLSRRNLRADVSWAAPGAEYVGLYSSLHGG
ncbi:hypothetical protein MNEG_12503 [Monoraphidium neglectum]|uniref:starch synthase n=1 Tax=Monoraphidium neglectum TaxID=145388 RepID=A0A0D2MKM6_9CHLO|nr:hypothetical protein MNEG_12503 [Monoraphidium neglectum]KIY95460.1 hypothetical protein MNEG_12503 [Monoraphidium neglectum]|eukprot:XP_013894480.1 hypothetical protein MNEG_12503 [Monoraphidium neglectum]